MGVYCVCVQSKYNVWHKWMYMYHARAFANLYPVCMHKRWSNSFACLLSVHLSSVVGMKIARAQFLSIWGIHKHNESVKISKKLASISRILWHSPQASQLQCSVLLATPISYMTLIGVHSTMHLIHPIYKHLHPMSCYTHETTWT